MTHFDKKILVVEDDEMLRKIIVEQLNKNYIVTPAKDGEEALQQIELNKPDLIILDLLLPKLDGFELLARLRAMPNSAVAKTPVIVVSNLADPDSISKVQPYSVEAYFTKSDITFGILINRINRLFDELLPVSN